MVEGLKASATPLLALDVFDSELKAEGAKAVAELLARSVLFLY